MQRQHELIPLHDRGFDEAPQRVAACRAVVFGRQHVREHLIEGPAGEEVKQVLAGPEVTVERRDADARVGRDGRQGHVRSLPVHGRGRGLDEGLVVAGRVAALFARTGLPRDCHGPIEPVSIANRYT
jgi:hypothetical protein